MYKHILRVRAIPTYRVYRFYDITHMHIYIHTHPYAHLHTHTQTCSPNTHQYTHTHTHTPTPHTHQPPIHTYTPIHTPAHPYLHTHTHTCTPTHTHLWVPPTRQLVGQSSCATADMPRHSEESKRSQDQRIAVHCANMNTMRGGKS